AEAIMGTAKEHARWQVTSGVSYKYHREFYVPKKNELYEVLKNECKKNIISENEQFLIVTDDSPCKHIAKLFQYDDVKIVEDDTKFIFQFETDGSLSAKDTLLVAIRRLKEKLGRLRDSITV
ncbi:MAG: DNA-directed RNA polymerase subunit D, partial [Thermoplasmata archaeon]